MKICIAIPTFNRVDLLAFTARSLESLGSEHEYTVRIFDDASTLISVDEIKALFPHADSITVRASRLGSDGNICQLYKDFLSSGEDVLLTVDSDLVLHPECLQVIERVLPQTSGILSLYNSCVHPFESECSIANERLVQKKSVGCAGVAFSRDVVQKIIEHVPVSEQYDWDWCDYLDRESLPIFVTQTSYIQHLGLLQGSNTEDISTFEYGLNFKFGNPATDSILAEALSRIILDENDGLRGRLKAVYEGRAFRLGVFLLRPLKSIVDIFKAGVNIFFRP